MSNFMKMLGVIALLLCPLGLHSQSSFTIPVQNTSGQAITGALVTLTCTDSVGGCFGSGPFSASSVNGNATFTNITNGNYSVTISGPGITAYTYALTVGIPAVSFSSLGSGTNSSGAMLVGTGASLGATGSGTITATSAPIGALPLTGTWAFGGTLSGNFAATGSDTFSRINGVIFVDGVTYPQTDVGIQNAVNDAQTLGASSGFTGKVVLPSGVYSICGTVTVTQPGITIIGAGWGTILQVCSSLSATTDIFHLIPCMGCTFQGMTLQDFWVKPQSGTPGRHFINIDGTNAALNNLVIRHVRNDQLGGDAIAVTNAGSLVTGTPAVMNVEDSLFTGKIDLTNAGDSVIFKGGQMTGSGGLVVALTSPGGTNGGPHGFEIQDINFTNTGGIYISNAWQGRITGGEIEVLGLTEANAACVDLDGNATTNIQDFQITGVYIACANGASSVDQIRVNRATHAIIERNFVARSVGGHDYNITANAIGSHVRFNTHAPSGELITTYLADSGTGTCLIYFDPNTNASIQSSACSAFSATNSTNRYFGCPASTQCRFGANIPFGFSSGNDVLSNGLDSAFSRIQAGFIGVGNGTFQDVSGTIQATAFIPPSAGTGSIGTTAIPFGNLWLGTAATNNFKFAPAATSAQRVVTLNDPGAAVNLPFTSNSDTTTTHVLHATATGNVFTSSAIAVADIPTAIPIGNVGSAGLSGTAPATISAAGAIGCATCVTSAASLANGGVVLGTAGTQASATNTQLTFVAPTLTVGLAGTSTGALDLTGVTSGNIAITAPAVAGTITNPITISNSLQLPSGTVYNWNADTGLSRDAAAVVDVGNGTAGNKSGSLALTSLLDANAKAFLTSTSTASAVDGMTITNAATANPATVTLAGSGTDANINTALNAKGSGVVQAATFLQQNSNKVVMTADWTCGTGGTVSSCVAATIVGSTGTPMTITLPLQALSWDFDCDGVVSSTTGTPANNWNMITATNGATNVTASYSMGTAAAVPGFGATTDQASTTTTFSIGGTWTLGAAATKFPFHIHARIEGASASGTVVSLQLVDPTVADLLTIYRGMECWVH
jgi:hypothetical protein